MHSIQTFILLQLSEHESLRYSDMKPISMEASQFMYHLKSLISSGLVTKTENMYSLSPKGKQYLDRFDHDNLELIQYPRVTVALLYEHQERGWLLEKRQHQPGLGKIGFMLVDVPLHYEPPITAFATDIFTRKTRIRAHFSHKADGYIRVKNNDHLEGNMLTHIMCARGGSLPESADEFLVWSNESTISKFFSSTQYVIEQLSRHSSFFFFEYTVEL